MILTKKSSTFGRSIREHKAIFESEKVLVLVLKLSSTFASRNVLGKDYKSFCVTKNNNADYFIS